MFTYDYIDINLSKGQNSPQDVLHKRFTDKQKAFDYMNVHKHIKTKDPQFEYLFCYEGFIRRVHPAPTLRNQDVSKNARLKTSAEVFFKKLMESHLKPENKGKMEYCYSVNYKMEDVFLMAAIADLSYFIKGIAPKKGFCAICMRIPKEEYLRKTEPTNIVSKIYAFIRQFLSKFF